VGFISCLQANLAEGNLLLGLSFPADVPASALEAPNAQFQSILRVTMTVFWHCCRCSIVMRCSGFSRAAERTVM
jgi:hypothetical protein